MTLALQGGRLQPAAGRRQWLGQALASCASVGVLMLAGCANFQRTVVPGMNLTGRMAVRVDGDAARSFTASFELAGTEREGWLTLTSPVGLSIAQAQWSPARVVLRSSDGEREFATLDAMSAETFGEPVPLPALMAWLQGHAWDGAPAEPPGSGVMNFTQMGWRVDLARHAEGVTVAVRPGAPTVTVRVIADRA